MSDTKRGWGWPGNARKAHYFDDDVVSICGGWMYTGPVTSPEDKGGGPDDCKKCVRKLAARPPGPDTPEGGERGK